MRKSAAQINRWIREQEARLGISTDGFRSKMYESPQPTVTVYPSPYVIERLAHAAADTKIAADPVYDAMCARTDAMLAEIVEGVNESFTPMPRSKSTCRARVPHVMVSD